MITITWYNIVAIVVGIIALGCIMLIPKEDGGLGDAIGFVFGFLLWLIVFGLFFAIWGGIFWW